jgi:YD repeat-containing protein
LALSSTVKGFDGTLINSSATYDLLGRTISVSRPYQGAFQGAVLYHYDTLNRPLDVTFPDGTFQKKTYTNPLETHHFDGRNNESFVQTNFMGQTLVSGNVLVQAGQPNQSINTSFEYGPFGMVTKVTDPKGNTTKMQYDVRGRRTQLTEPDRGTTTTAYNGFGEVREETHLASGEKHTYGHDAHVEAASGQSAGQWFPAAVCRPPR